MLPGSPPAHCCMQGMLESLLSRLESVATRLEGISPGSVSTLRFLEHFIACICCSLVRSKTGVAHRHPAITAGLCLCWPSPSSSHWAVWCASASGSGCPACRHRHCRSLGAGIRSPDTTSASCSGPGCCPSAVRGAGARSCTAALCLTSSLTSVLEEQTGLRLRHLTCSAHHLQFALPTVFSEVMQLDQAREDLPKVARGNPCPCCRYRVSPLC